MQKNVRMWWGGDERGWIIDTEVGMTPWEIDRCIKHTMKIQSDRFLTLPPGDKKDECARTIRALADRKVQQNIAGVGDRVMFDAYKSNGKRIFYR